MAAVVFAGARAAHLVLQLIGYRMAGTMALASAGPTLLKLVVRMLGGPVNYLPEHLLDKAISKATSAPMVMLLGQGSATTGFAVRAALVVLNTVTDGLKYLVINMAASSVTKAIKSLATRVIFGAEQQPAVRAVENLASIEIIENYDAKNRVALSPQERAERRLQSRPAAPASDLRPVHMLSSSSPSSSGSDTMPPPSSLGVRVTDGVQMEVVECTNDEIEKLMASIQLPPTHDPTVPRNKSPPSGGAKKVAAAVGAGAGGFGGPASSMSASSLARAPMVDADALKDVLDRSTQILERSGGAIYPRLDELEFGAAEAMNDPEVAEAEAKMQWILADSIMAQDNNSPNPNPNTVVGQPMPKMPELHESYINRPNPNVDLLLSRLQPPFGPGHHHAPLPEALVTSWFELPPSAPPLSISDFEMIAAPKDVKERDGSTSSGTLLLDDLLDDEEDDPLAAPYIPDGGVKSGFFGGFGPKYFSGSASRSQPLDARPSLSGSQLRKPPE